MDIKRYGTIGEINGEWDALAGSLYQEKAFLLHLEKYNYCNQRYYTAFHQGHIMAGAAVYTLKTNLLTFSGLSLNLPMTVIGIAASVDAGGVLGAKEYAQLLIDHILQNEKGLILCLNYDDADGVPKIVEMNTLPTMILENSFPDWDGYMSTLRHSYRRRISLAGKRFNGSRISESSCSLFSDEHYLLYREIMKRTRTKLEVLPAEFFSKLPEPYRLHSLYSSNDELLSWHISISRNGTHYFLFGGINYALLDQHDSYINNLVSIIREGIQSGCKVINLGQTAQIAKTRLGAAPVAKKMFLYHPNTIARLGLRLGRRLISYRSRNEKTCVFKTESS